MEYCANDPPPPPPADINAAGLSKKTFTGPTPLTKRRDPQSYYNHSKYCILHTESHHHSTYQCIFHRSRNLIVVFWTSKQQCISREDQVIELFDHWRWRALKILREQWQVDVCLDDFNACWCHLLRCPDKT
jgi:hypothetical protein